MRNSGCRAGEQGQSYNTGRPLEGSGGQTMTGMHTQVTSLSASHSIYVLVCMSRHLSSSHQAVSPA